MRIAVITLFAAASLLAGVVSAAGADDVPSTERPDVLAWLERYEIDVDAPAPTFEAAEALELDFWSGDGRSYCLGDDYWLDTDGDERPSVDLLAVRSEGACDSEPGMSVHLEIALNGGQVIAREVGVNVDLDLDTGCGGWDGVAVSAVPIGAQWIDTPTCDPDGWTLREGLTGAGGYGESLTFDIPRMDGTVAWYAAIYGADDSVDSTITFLTPAVDVECEPTPPSTDSTDGYWLATLHGEIYSMGSAPDLGQICEPPGARSIVDLETIVDDGELIWLALHADGRVRTPDDSGAATVHSPGFPVRDLAARQAVALLVHQPDVDHLSPWPRTNEPQQGLSSEATGMVVFDDGLIHVRSGAGFGDLRDVELNAPIIDAQMTPTGNGYWLIGADGGVFSFGDAQFSGSTGSLTLNEPVVGMAPDPDGDGYWLVATDGGVFAFDAPFVGSIPGVLAPGTQLNRPVVAMVPYGDGYLLLGSDGGVFNFSDRDFAGSLGSNPPIFPVVAVQPIPST